MKTWQLRHAKNRLSEVIEQALAQGPQVITRRGADIVVVLSVEEYRRLRRPKEDLVEFFRSSPLVEEELDLERSQEYSIAQAKNHLPQLIREAEAGHDVCLTQRGKPVATLVGVERYEALTSEKRSFWEAYESFRAQYDLAELEIDVQDVYGNIRDKSPGRDFSW